MQLNSTPTDRRHNR